ncbi:hypothetical protein N7452_001175 [Penicillium brevicompactum]|uniref:Azaphilone pigments biosynthesis cluster protein L N-terminal domain-containing protein n=1 Tax=Penicillium brevicompactum TaxID=5074 RepID=A0A9W9R1X3_PENBR|nr:hypothetical protein N7452_001175 [Penicillium brevicompactum]
MGDPISLAGTAVGIVSLGLSVCQGIFSYCSCFRDCPKETKNMLQKLEGLKDVLEVLEDVFQSHENLRTETPAVKAAKRHILACENGLLQLKDILDKSKATPTNSKRDLINRAAYPFKRDTIRAILEHLESLQSNLDTSISVLQLQV